MATSLYDLSAGSYIQLLGGVSGFLDKGLAYCNDHHIDPKVIMETRLYPNMLPFRFQILQMCHHSIGAMEALQSGEFHTAGTRQAADYAELQKHAADSLVAIQAFTPEQVNAWENKDIIFHYGELKLPFTAANFIMSFSFPNLYFHATTAYDILRSVGVPLGKRDFLGMLRMKS